MPFKTAPSVPNITSPLPHCTPSSGLSLFGSYFPSPSCGHVVMSIVCPFPARLCCLSGVVGWSLGVLACLSYSHLQIICSLVADHVMIQLLTLLQFYSLRLSPASFAKFLKNLDFPRSTHFFHEELSTINLPDLGSMRLPVLTTLTSGCEQEISLNVSTYLLSVS